MALNVVSRTKLRDFWLVHEKAKGPLEKWYDIVRHATWLRAEDVRKTYNSADGVNGFTVFDVGGGFRVVVDIAFSQGFVFIKHVFTHTEYDKWSDQQRKLKGRRS